MVSRHLRPTGTVMTDICLGGRTRQYPRIGPEVSLQPNSASFAGSDEPGSLYEGFVNAKFFEERRREMVAAIRVIAEHMAPQTGKTGLDERVLMAMAKVPRHEFVPIEVQQYAYLNRPIPIGFDKTISQPMMVAVMTDLLELKPDDVVLEIGTGLGYQAAVLAELAGRVYSVEIIDELAQRATKSASATAIPAGPSTPRSTK